jgi:hypothetical protein
MFEQHMLGRFKVFSIKIKLKQYTSMIIESRNWKSFSSFDYKNTILSEYLTGE